MIKLALQLLIAHMIGDFLLQPDQWVKEKESKRLRSPYFVFVFILLGQWSAIGFLITAKSVFRFGDLSKANDRKLTEYILLGTFLSFGLAILASLIYQHLSLVIHDHNH